MPYDLISDGQPVPLGDKKYLLSPQDLAGLEVLPDLIRAGVASLKIEGRLKAPEYVASITRVYRQALDNLRFTNDDLRDANQSARKSEIVNRKYELEMSFSRGLFTGWFGGIDNQKLVHARFGKKRGVFLGEVKRVSRDGVSVNLVAPLKPGDGVVFDTGRPDEKEEGGRVYEIKNSQLKTQNSEAELRFGFGDIDFSRVRVGDKIWKTDDPELNKNLRQTFAGDKIRFQRPIEIKVHGLAGKPLTLIARDESGNVVRVESAMPLTAAEKIPLTTDKLHEQLGRLGGTPFRLGELKNFLSGNVMLPVSELNRLRREAVSELEKLRAQPKRWQLNVGQASSLSQTSKEKNGDRQDACPTLIALVRNLAQLEAALKCGETTIYCEFEDPKKYREAIRLRDEWLVTSDVTKCDSSSPAIRHPSQIFVAPPRIFKTGEDWILQQVRSANADGYLIRNYDHLKFFADERRVGDFSLNVANQISADYFKNHFGLERVTASYDLNVTQLEALLLAAPTEWFEVTIHQHMPMFHMEHCVFCAFLSKGKDYHDCGRPCDKHEVKLKDRVGAEHPLKADAGCRNTVFNSRAQTGADFVEQLLALGVRNFRVEFLNETPEEVTRTIAKYRQLLHGEISGAQLWRDLKLFNQLGVTRGQMGN
jgi:putative protease